MQLRWNELDSLSDASLMMIKSLRELPVDQGVLKLFDKFKFDKAHNFKN